MDVASELSKAKSRFGWAISKEDFASFVDELEAKGVTASDMVDACHKTSIHATGGFAVTLDTLLESAYRIRGDRKDSEPPTPSSHQLSDERGRILGDEESLTRVQSILEKLRRSS